MRRQRSLEWRNERDCSSSDDDIARPVESQIFASLLAQAQKEFKGKKLDNMKLHSVLEWSQKINLIQMRSVSLSRN